MSRDSGTEDCESLQDCQERVDDAERFYRRIGYCIWFAVAISPTGEKITLHNGNPYY